MADTDDRNDIEEMDRLFRKADFAAENENLEKRLRKSILGRLAARANAARPASFFPCPSTELEEERELESEELLGLAAAGTGEDGTAAQSTLRKIFGQ